ncbi:MAG TPA: hypothetical protein VGF30_15965 [Bacteroidia bacterium]
MKKFLLFPITIALNILIACGTGDDEKSMENTAGETGVTSNSSSADTMNPGYSVPPKDSLNK